MGPELSCMLYYVVSALLGGLLSWLLFGGKSAEISRITNTAIHDKAALQEALAELNTFKNDAKASITAKENEISKLKKSSAFPEIITKAQEKEIKHWKEKANLLEQDLKKAKKATPAITDTKSKEAQVHLEKELKSARKSLTLKNNKIEELTQLAKKNAAAIQQPDLETTRELNKLRKKLKKLKKKVKAQKNVTKTIEIKETLDLDKLKTLLASGELTSQSKKVSKKSPKSKSKKSPTKSDS